MYLALGNFEVSRVDANLDSLGSGKALGDATQADGGQRWGGRVVHGGLFRIDSNENHYSDRGCDAERSDSS
ncbi:hypothetical protein SDC9_114224 [bioreactor metagenome]|uniref:Uncharacterized protein n=1 Tax=bioreactor metagenome TaxID=1076179 RepID=A0A645BQ14_9ZZZZ